MGGLIAWPASAPSSSSPLSISGTSWGPLALRSSPCRSSPQEEAPHSSHRDWVGVSPRLPPPNPLMLANQAPKKPSWCLPVCSDLIRILFLPPARTIYMLIGKLGGLRGAVTRAHWSCQGLACLCSGLSTLSLPALCLPNAPPSYGKGMTNALFYPYNLFHYCSQHEASRSIIRKPPWQVSISLWVLFSSFFLFFWVGLRLYLIQLQGSRSKCKSPCYDSHLRQDGK